MPEKFSATTAASFHRRNHGMDEAMKAGIGATVCSVLILAIVLLAMHMLPVSIGYAADSGWSVSLHTDSSKASQQ
jgi:hypothetical protein